MMKRILPAFAVALLLGADTPSEAAKDDLMKMQGEWKVEKAQRGGKDAPAEIADKLSIKVTDNTISIIQEGNAREEKADVKLDPAKKPAAIDIKPQRPDSAVGKGIYKIDGDTLTLCWSKEGDRPTEFATKAGSDQRLFVLKRKK